MAANQKRENGRHLRVTPTNGAATSGAPGLFGQMPGVAEDDVATDGMCTMDFGGVYSLSVKGIDNSGNAAITAGDIIYYDTATTPKLSADAVGTVRFGYALEDVGSAATATILVKIGY